MDYVKDITNLTLKSYLFPIETPILTFKGADIEVVGATVTIDVIGASNLENKEIRGLVDPYAVLTLGDLEHRTKRIDDTCDPV